MNPYIPARIKAFGLHLNPEGGLKIEPLTPSAHNIPLPRATSAAIGSFDGVHLGHATVIKSAVKAQMPTSVISFDPHPQTYFRPGSEPFRLMSLHQQFLAFEALGVDYIFVLRFDAVMAGLSAQDFAQRVLQNELGLVHISAGFDFSFGARGLGKAADLERFGEACGFSTTIIGCQSDEDGEKLASSSVREALMAGDVTRARKILGRPQAYEGKVIKGDQLGRTIGFATLNMDMGSYVRPRFGVYASRTRLEDGRLYKSITNIGIRPTVNGRSERFETHVFDFDADIYGQTHEVELTSFIRPEQKFDSLDALKAQIAKDADVARQV
jgi:riboflavin kinase / FMN adenylyltransferase